MAVPKDILPVDAREVRTILILPDIPLFHVAYHRQLRRIPQSPTEFAGLSPGPEIA